MDTSPTLFCFSGVVLKLRGTPLQHPLAALHLSLRTNNTSAIEQAKPRCTANTRIP